MVNHYYKSWEAMRSSQLITLHICNSKSVRKAVMEVTKREQEILELIAAEFTSEQIAEKLTISLSTVESHRQNMMRKFEVKSVVGLLKAAYKNGLIKI